MKIIRRALCFIGWHRIKMMRGDRIGLYCDRESCEWKVDHTPRMPY